MLFRSDFQVHNNNFQLTIKNNVDKAKKALFKLRAETSGHELATQKKLHLFDSIILPILTYGCEVWGHELYKQIEIFYRNFLRTLSNVRNSTPNSMMYGELGSSEKKYQIWFRSLGFWRKLSYDKNKKQTLVPDVQVPKKNFPFRKMVVLCSNNTDRMRNSRCLSFYRKC